jgi:Fe-S-cluster-containing dehydrogenase component
MDQALGPLAAKCVAACPTGALYFSPVRELVTLQNLARCGPASPLVKQAKE